MLCVDGSFTCVYLLLLQLARFARGTPIAYQSTPSMLICTMSSYAIVVVLTLSCACVWCVVHAVLRLVSQLGSQGFIGHSLAHMFHVRVCVYVCVWK